MVRRLPRSRHFRLGELDRGLYAAIATEEGAGLCNSGIVDLGGLTVVFDSMLTPLAGTELCRAAERITGRRPDVLVNSHWHGDHIRGNASFAPVRVVSTRATRALIARRGPRQLADDHRTFPRELARVNDPDSPIPARDRPMYRGWFSAAIATPRSMRFLLPDVTFTDELSLEGSRRTAFVRTFGGGHSPSDVFVHLPEERTVFLGDLMNTGMHPSVSDGHPGRWIEILRRIEALRPTVALPGHGEVGGMAEIREVERYLADLRALARRMTRRGAPPGRRSPIEVPARYAHWKFSGFYRSNLQRARTTIDREP